MWLALGTGLGFSTHGQMGAPIVVSRRVLRSRNIAADKNLILERLVAGPERGADRAALYAGRSLGYETGGFVPKGYFLLQTKDAELLEAYGLSELTVPDRATAHFRTIELCDMSILFGHVTFGGLRLLHEMARGQGKPVYLFPYDAEYGTAQQGSLLRALLVEHQVRTLHVGGARSAVVPEIFKYTKAILMAALEDF